ncbi:MAG: FHA domain-containing protein, partial [Dehalococcoidia bacterium]
IEKEGGQIGRAFQLESEVTDIGRDPRNHLVISDPMVSAFHARIERDTQDRFVLRDRGSSNGTRLNGEPLTQAQVLNENDEVGFGGTAMVLKVVS